MNPENFSSRAAMVLDAQRAADYDRERALDRALEICPAGEWDTADPTPYGPTAANGGAAPEPGSGSAPVTAGLPAPRWWRLARLLEMFADAAALPSGRPPVSSSSRAGARARWEGSE